MYDNTSAVLATMVVAAMLAGRRLPQTGFSAIGLVSLGLLLVVLRTVLILAKRRTRA